MNSLDGSQLIMVIGLAGELHSPQFMCFMVFGLLKIKTWVFFLLHTYMPMGVTAVKMADCKMSEPLTKCFLSQDGTGCMEVMMVVQLQNIQV